ncbi:acyl-CoA N-acyltransferase [Suillus paluster]|uniref:acyl-CoA N-acyltransferase n=1 Tax=Suillus paluster TaxID=48578 RepID=UPI001B868C19|nr:acyl-CoA N-acyltransferase [Suillus paluster]KAG1732407.1 acyl-CoA N-acyltransferase [Suillus paluster]
MTYRLFPITEPVTHEDIENYKALRLTSLKIDPSSFSSTYEREIAFTPEIWAQRLTSRFKRTFITSTKDEGSISETWIGMVSVLGPSELIPSMLELFERVGVGSDWDMYILVGMWVHPEHRGRGLGTRLVKEGVEWVRTNMDPKNDVEGRRDKMVLLLVGDDNASGRALYQKMGFTDSTSMPPDGEGHSWMSLKVS